MMRVQETFFSIYVRDMDRAVSFYETALGATVDYVSTSWSSLVIAGVRVSLVLSARSASMTGMHFIVDDVALACAAVVYSGGQIEPAVETAAGIVIAEMLDSEGNTFTLRQRCARASVQSRAA
jgi:predicted enzyme related to lactoylglutathione lyase